MNKEITPIAELDISPAVGVPVRQGHIDFMFSQLEAYKKKAAAKPEFKVYVHEIEKEIELMRRELVYMENALDVLEKNQEWLDENAKKKAAKYL